MNKEGPPPRTLATFTAAYVGVPVTDPLIPGPRRIASASMESQVIMAEHVAWEGPLTADPVPVPDEWGPYPVCSFPGDQFCAGR